MTGKKVKNVIRGYKSQWGEIEELVIIENDRIVFFGKPENFTNPIPIMKEQAREYQMKEVQRTLNHNNSKLILFV
jgi:hypothetical protein